VRRLPIAEIDIEAAVAVDGTVQVRARRQIAASLHPRPAERARGFHERGSIPVLFQH
jgi:hypothetical protein